MADAKWRTIEELRAESISEWRGKGIFHESMVTQRVNLPFRLSDRLRQAELVRPRPGEVHQDAVPGPLMTQGIFGLPSLHCLRRRDGGYVVCDTPVPVPLLFVDLLG